jgi:hypothetical protein
VGRAYSRAVPVRYKFALDRHQIILGLMRTKLRVVAIFLALGFAGFWFFGGPNFGWTKDSIAQQVKDPVTEIEATIYTPRFVPGVDFLGAGISGAAVLMVVSFFMPKKTVAQK